MAGSFRRRRTTTGEEPLLFGWCMGPDGAALSHCALDQDGEPVEALDAQGNRLPGFCPGYFDSANDTKNWKKGTRIYCQCPCHGDDQPEAYPGYAVSREASSIIAAQPDEDDDEYDEPVLDIRQPGPPEPVEQDPVDPDDEVLEDESEAPTASSDVSLEVETKRIKYANGEVARVEVPGIGRGGKTVTNVNWVAYDKSGTRLGREWSLTGAKKLLP